MKSLLSLLLAVMIFLTACTPTSSPASPSAPSDTSADPQDLNAKDPVTVVLWHYYVSENQQVLENAVNEFNQTVGAEQGVFVESVAKGSIVELETAVSNSAKGVINSEPMPDIFSSYPDKAIEIDSLGMISDLNQYFTEEEKKEYIPGFLSDGIFDNGRFLILPIVKSTELLYLNATAWNEFTAATDVTNDALQTWEGYYETARRYYAWTDAKTPNIPWDGESMGGLDSIPNFVLIGNKQLGNDMIDADRKEIVLDLPVLHKAFDIYVKAMALEYFNASGKFRSDNVKSGELIAYTGSSSSAAYFPTWIEKSGVRQDIEMIAMPYPTFAGGEPFSIQQGAGMCISNSTPKKEKGAALFLKWFTAQKQNLNFAMNSGYLPVTYTAYQSEFFQNSIQKLYQGTASQKNVASVYEITLEQTKHNTYAAKPFDGSYKIRLILQSTLSAAAEAAKNSALDLKAKGLSEEQILLTLDLETRFQSWINSLKQALDNEGIAYRQNDSE